MISNGSSDPLTKVLNSHPAPVIPVSPVYEGWALSSRGVWSCDCVPKADPR